MTLRCEKVGQSLNSGFLFCLSTLYILLHPGGVLLASYKEVGMIAWIKQDKRHYISEDKRYRLFKWEDWHLQDMEYRGGLSSIAMEPTLVAIKKEAARHARAQSFSERVKGDL